MSADNNNSNNNNNNTSDYEDSISLNSSLEEDAHHHHNPVHINNNNNNNNSSREDDLHSQEDEEPTIQRTQTIASSLSDKTLLKPKSQRRGLLCQLSLIPEFKDARNYPPRLKNAIVFIVAMAALIGPMGTSIVLPAIENIKADLNTTTMKVNISIGIYLMALGVFPIWWSSFSERLGRRSVYISSFTLYMAFGFGCALSPTIDVFIGMRVLSGACSASVQAVGAGTVYDLYPPEQRGRALGVFYLGALLSPLISPIVGALLLVRWDWRSTQWFCLVLAGVINVMVILFLPETLKEQDNKAFIAKVLAERRSHKENNSNNNKDLEKGEEPHHDHTQDEEEEEEDDDDDEETDANIIERVASRISARTNENALNVDTHMYPIHDEVNHEVLQADLERMKSNISKTIDQGPQTKWQNIKTQSYIFFIQPLKALYFFQYPPVALSISFSAITFAILYVVNMTIEYEYARDPYDWRSLYVGFAYIPNSISYILASIFGGKWTDRLLQNFKKKHGYNAAEARISYNVLSAVIVLPIALLIIGWCFHFHTFWVTPLIGTFLFGYSQMMIIGPTVTYIVDSLPGRGATGVALNNLVRQAMACAAVFLFDPMVTKMNTGPLMSMCAGVAVCWSVVLVVLKKRGNYWRENYDLQKLYDKLE